jgi:hypothetical protein
MRQTPESPHKILSHLHDTKSTKRKLFLPWCLAVLVVNIFIFPAWAADLAALEEANALLQAEYQLAKKEQLYFFFDLPARQVRIKASGVTLATLPAAQVQQRGQRGQAGLRSLRARQTSSPPQRVAIDPGAVKKAGKFELQALELDDMPDAYRLLLDDGTILTVAPRTEGFWGQLTEMTAQLRWRLICKWYSLRGKPYTELRLTLAAPDARRLYWSFQEEMACLIAWHTP